LITEAKDLLERIVKQRIEGVTVVRSAADESHAIMQRQFPLVALITNPGPFDGAQAQTYRYFEENKEYKQRYAQGNRNIPILLRCWSTGEKEADAVFSRIIPAIPSRWNYDGFTGSIEIGTEEHSDHAGNVAKLYLSVVDVRFSVAAAMEPGEVPYFEKAELDGVEYINPQDKEDVCPK
jgi:hypothetical protein